MRIASTIAALGIVMGFVAGASAGPTVEDILTRGCVSKGILALVGRVDSQLAVEAAKRSELLVYVQLSDFASAEAVRYATYEAGLLGTRIFVDDLNYSQKIGLADNLADVAVAVDSVGVSESELRRIVRPGGKTITPNGVWTKSFPAGVDDWTHHYHGPENNPQSRDQLARAPYRTQFVAEPRYAPGPQISVSSAGRLFMAFGNFAWHEREEPWLDTLVAVNAFNGTMLWKRPITSGIMVDRSTMIATPDVLYLADEKSCKVLDAASGRQVDEIIPPADVVDGTFWKWMALDSGVLYALIGEQEPLDPQAKWKSERHGWPWNGISKGYNESEYRWGFGKTLLALDPKTKKVLWHVQSDPPIDSRSLAMHGGRIYGGTFGRRLMCLDARSGKTLWQRTAKKDPEVFAAIGPYRPGHGYIGGWKSTVYLKATAKAIYFLGPQVEWLTALSAEDGRVLWKHPAKDLHIIVRDEGLFTIGPQNTNNDATKKLDPLTGEVLESYLTKRRACTRATGTPDGIFFRAQEGSGRFDLASGKTQWVSPMRPSCMVGVVVANGHLYWVPWACDCDLQLFGVIGLSPAGSAALDKDATVDERLNVFVKNKPPALENADWPTHRANSERSAFTPAKIAEQVSEKWSIRLPQSAEPTAPVIAGGRVLVGDSRGAVHAFDLNDGRLQWTVLTGGAIRHAPTIDGGEAWVGSADGHAYAIDIRQGVVTRRFRAAPTDRRIAMYNTLASNWPVASGVLIDRGVAYFAAGLTDFDGTHVFAFDTRTNQLRWQNHSAGQLDEFSRRGVACQGELLLADGKLYLAGGNAVSPGVFDLETGKCLTPAPTAMGSTATRGRELALVSGRVVPSGQPLYSLPGMPVFDKSTDWMPVVVRAANAQLSLETAKRNAEGQGTSLVARRDLNTVLWQRALPADPVRWGVAVASDARIALALATGQIVCLGPK